eukprot:274045_1
MLKNQNSNHNGLNISNICQLFRNSDQVTFIMTNDYIISYSECLSLLNHIGVISAMCINVTVRYQWPKEMKAINKTRINEYRHKLQQLKWSRTYSTNSVTFCCDIPSSYYGLLTQHNTEPELSLTLTKPDNKRSSQKLYAVKMTVSVTQEILSGYIRIYAEQIQSVHNKLISLVWLYIKPPSQYSETNEKKYVSISKYNIRRSLILVVEGYLNIHAPKIKMIQILRDLILYFYAKPLIMNFKYNEIINHILVCPIFDYNWLSIQHKLFYKTNCDFEYVKVNYGVNRAKTLSSSNFREFQLNENEIYFIGVNIDKLKNRNQKFYLLAKKLRETVETFSSIAGSSLTPAGSSLTPKCSIHLWSPLSFSNVLQFLTTVNAYDRVAYNLTNQSNHTYGHLNISQQLPTPTLCGTASTTTNFNSVYSFNNYSGLIVEVNKHHSYFFSLDCKWLSHYSYETQLFCEYRSVRIPNMYCSKWRVGHKRYIQCRYVLESMVDQSTPKLILTNHDKRFKRKIAKHMQQFINQTINKDDKPNYGAKLFEYFTSNYRKAININITHFNEGHEYFFIKHSFVNHNNSIFYFEKVLKLFCNASEIRLSGITLSSKNYQIFLDNVLKPILKINKNANLNSIEILVKYNEYDILNRIVDEYNNTMCQLHVHWIMKKHQQGNESLVICRK